MNGKNEEASEKMPVQQGEANQPTTTPEQGGEKKELGYDRDLDKVEGNMNNGETGGFGKGEEGKIKA